MGLFRFAASAGRVLGGSRTTHQDGSQPLPKPPTGSAILNEFKKLGLAQLGGLNVTVQGRTATVTARAPDAETREKAILAAGNIAGIEAVQANIAVPEPAPEPTFHTVQEGETLAGIAEAHLGDAEAHPVLSEANAPILHEPGEVYPGQVIRIPENGAAKE